MVKDKVVKRTKLLVNTVLKDTNLIASANSKVLPVSEYLMKICKFSYGELNKVVQIIKRQLRVKNMLKR